MSQQYQRVMKAVRRCKPDAEDAFVARCRAFGKCPAAQSDEQGDAFFVFLCAEFGDEFAVALVPELVKMLPAADKQDALMRAAKFAPAPAGAAGAPTSPPAPARAQPEARGSKKEKRDGKGKGKDKDKAEGGAKGGSSKEHGGRHRRGSGSRSGRRTRHERRPRGAGSAAAQQEEGQEEAEAEAEEQEEGEDALFTSDPFAMPAGAGGGAALSCGSEGA
eukprot:g2536.t1